MNTVLVVEDDEKSRRLLVDVLGARGYRVLAFERGEEALAAVAATAPDLAVLDIHLPGIDGVQTLFGLRAASFGTRPALAVTASVMSGDLARLHAAGFDAVLQKPLRLRDFLGTVQRLLARPAAPD